MEQTGVYQRDFYLVYQENGTTYYTKGDRITDRIGIKMLKASCHLVNKYETRTYKRFKD